MKRVTPKTHQLASLNTGRTWRCLVALLLLNAARTAPAQTLSIGWSRIAGGGGASTASSFAVSGTVGQPDASGPLTNGQYSVRGGFWALPIAVQSAGAPLLAIVPANPGQVTISWTPATPGFVLQETLSVAPSNWANSASGAANPVTIPTTLPMKLYRLRRP